MKLSDLKQAASYYPMATRRTAVRQGARLLQAKQYMAGRGIEATRLGTGFKYERSTGSVLS